MPTGIQRLSLIAAALVLVVAVPALQPQRARAAGDPENPTIRLSWRAPFGEPRATDSLGVSCADSSRSDTLFLTFSPSQDESAFVGIGGEIRIHAQPDDSLGPFWKMGPGGANRGGLIMQFGPNETMPGTTPWPMGGLAVVDYRPVGGYGRFRFGCTLALNSKAHLSKGVTYTIGRILIRGVSAHLTGCDAPVCFEWHRSEFVFGGGRDFWRTSDGSATVVRGAAGEARRYVRKAAQLTHRSGFEERRGW